VALRDWIYTFFSNKFVISVLDTVKPFCWNYIFIEILFRQCIMSCWVGVWDGIWLLLLGIFPNLMSHINCLNYLILLFCVVNLQVWKLIFLSIPCVVADCSTFSEDFTACRDVLLHGEVLLLWSKFFFSILFVLDNLNVAHPLQEEMCKGHAAYCPLFCS
jgi:hypothetical protein